MFFYTSCVCCCHYGIQNKPVSSFTIPDAEALRLTGLVYSGGSIILDEVNCTGEESQLFECGHNGIRNHDCSHYQDAGVRCTGEISILAKALPPGLLYKCGGSLQFVYIHIYLIWREGKD